MNKIINKNIKYIKFRSYKPGGVGHSLCDYLTIYILAKVLKLTFIHSPLYIKSMKHGLNIDCINNTLFYNDFLNLDLINNNILPKNCKIIEFTKEYIRKYQRYEGISLKEYINIINEKVDENINEKDDICISIYPCPPRFFLLDLYNMEFHGLVNKGITLSIINDLRNVFFKKHCISKNKYFTINIYIRQGDLNKGIEFQYNILKYLYKFLENKELYKINLISAGTNKQMETIKKNFKIFEDINFILNSLQTDEVFMLLVQSDLLIYNFSGFPFTASLYCSGNIIASKENRYTSPILFYKDEIFLDNYILIKENETNFEYLDNKINKLF